MHPPTYDQATLPPALGMEASHVHPPPSYYASLSYPPAPPPPYEETVGARQPVNERQPQVAVAVSQPQATQMVSIGGLVNTSGRVRCPHCRNDVNTEVKQRPGKRAYTLCCVLAFSGLVCGFCLIPFMISDFWDVYHYCPHCGKQLHIHHKS